MQVNQAGTYCKTLRAVVRFLLDHSYYLQPRLVSALELAARDLRELRHIIACETARRITRQQVAHMRSIGRAAERAAAQLPLSLRKELYANYPNL